MALLGVMGMLLFHAVALTERMLLPWVREITG
jgi:ABC-type nitrate/sulfonate/bicarbonate transport system permease component